MSDKNSDKNSDKTFEKKSFEERLRQDVEDYLSKNRELPRRKVREKIDENEQVIQDLSRHLNMDESSAKKSSAGSDATSPTRRSWAGRSCTSVFRSR